MSEQHMTQRRKFVSYGPIRTSEKVVCLDLFTQIFCHCQRFTSADGLSRPDKFCPKQTNLQTHRRQNLSRVKLRQSKQNCVKLVTHLSEKLSRPAW